MHNRYAVEAEMEKSKIEVEQLELEDRNEEVRIYEVFYKISTHRFFQIFINLVIISNAIVLAQDSYYSDEL